MNSPVWHPYAHLKTQTPAPKVVGGSGSYFTLESGERLLDATCSWWCMIHGYGHPRLVAAIREQAGELCHVMLGGLTHDPADQLAQELVRITPPGLNHVFYSDSGSVGMEVAMKMALQYQVLSGHPGKRKMLSLMKRTTAIPPAAWRCAIPKRACTACSPACCLSTTSPRPPRHPSMPRQPGRA